MASAVAHRDLARSTSMRALTELLLVGLRWELWWTLAWTDTKLRYRRTTLGLSWITLTMAATVFSVGLLYGTIFGHDISQYLPYFAVGLIVWTFISVSMVDGCVIFIQAAGIIKTIPIPLVLHVYRLLARSVILLLHNAVLLILLAVIYPWPIGWATLLALPGLVLVTIALFGIALVFSTITTRFRDFQLAVVTLLQLFFLLTPIFWLPTSIGNSHLRLFLDLNPFYHLIMVVREPLLGTAPDLNHWIVATAIAAASLGFGVACYARLRHRVVFWL